MTVVRAGVHCVNGILMLASDRYTFTVLYAIPILRAVYLSFLSISSANNICKFATLI